MPCREFVAGAWLARGGLTILSGLSFENQVAVITGATGGVGKAMASALASNGATLILMGRNLESLGELSRGMQTNHGEIFTYRADLSIERDMAEISAWVQKKFERVDILIHSAGVIAMGVLSDAAIDKLDWQYRINVRAPFLLTQLLLPALKSSRGQIVFFNSSAGMNPNANCSQYSVTKFALRALAESLRQEVNAEGVRILNVFLGRTASPMQRRIHEMEGRKYCPERLIQPEDIAAIVSKALELPRSVEVTDIHLRPMLKPSLIQTSGSTNRNEL